MKRDPADLRTDTRWWGWGDPAVDVDVGDGIRILLEERGFEVKETGDPSARSLDDISLPKARRIPDAVLSAAGSDSVFTDRESRVRHATGQSLTDLLELRAFDLPSAPDAVIVARDQDQVEAILAAAMKSEVAVIPYGGGTSVVGGVTPPIDHERPVVSLVTSGLIKYEVDLVSQTATLGAGLRGPEAEARLRNDGFTLGHWPQSWEYATIGGFAATRSAGQASNGYGRFDDMVLAARMITPSGLVETPPVSHASEGPSLLETILGSEGTFGVITEVKVEVKPEPVSAQDAWILPDFESGIELTRELAQGGPLPAIVRLSDENETSLNLAMSSPGGVAGFALDAYLKLRRAGEGSMLILGFEGEPNRIRAERSAVKLKLRRSGAVPLGARAGRAWERGRFHGPYLREGLLDLGLLVETFETAAPWSAYAGAVRETANSVSEAMARSGANGRLLCHLSHAYRDGASIYFTVVASAGPNGPAASWRDIKEAALAAFRRLDLPVSHHHGIGRDHREAFEARVGDTGVQAIEGLRNALDPAGIMNPGCLLPERDRHTP